MYVRNTTYRVIVFDRSQINGLRIDRSRDSHVCTVTLKEQLLIPL